MAVPLTAYPGIQMQPSLAPDGNQVAFSWNGPNEDNYDIYVKLVGPGEPVRLTTDPQRDVNPAWSPDGRQIAFLRHSSQQQAGVFLIPALGGGAEKKLTEITVPRLTTVSNLAWSPDGRNIVLGGRFGDVEPPGVWLISVETAEHRRITTTPGDIGDYGPSFSPDGRSIAFVREVTGNAGDLYLQRLTSALAPAGQPVRLTFDEVRIEAVAWVNNHTVAYCPGYIPAMRRVRILEIGERDEPLVRSRTPDFGEGAFGLSISRSGQLVYARQMEDANIWQLRLPSSGASQSERLIASTFDDSTPDYSPDGRKIVFTSTRNGTEEIWVSDADGAHPIQITSMNSGHRASARWSPDGKTIVFCNYRPRSDLFTLDVRTGSLQRLTDEPPNEAQPSWSRDGKFIYYTSNKTGLHQIYRIASTGGLPVQVTSGGGTHAEESTDGKWLYYAKSVVSPTAIWKVPIAGGKEEQVLEGLSWPVNFVPVDQGIYFMSVGHEPNDTAIELHDFATRRRKLLMRLGKRWSWGMALSPNRRSLLYSVVDHASSNLMLVTDFQ